MKKALEIVPSDAGLYFRIGQYYAKIEDQNNAKAAYRQGLAWYMDEEENEDIINVRAKLAEWSE
jgi:Tfp pilus assembly protein PilF